MIINSTGGGGAALNFSVKAYASDIELPAVAPENTVAVITDTEITSWIFAAEQPAEPVEGMVWVQTGESSAASFNALKKNKIMVYPSTCKQYVRGVWVDRSAKTGKSGAWVDWIDYLFKSGSGAKVAFTSATAGGNGIVNITNEKIAFTYQSAGSAWSVATTENSLDLSKKKTLYVDMTLKSMHDYYGGTAVVGITPAKGAVVNNGQPEFSVKVNPSPDGVRRTIAVSISNVSAGYVTMYGIMNADIFNIWLE